MHKTISIINKSQKERCWEAPMTMLLEYKNGMNTDFCIIGEKKKEERIAGIWT